MLNHLIINEHDAYENNPFFSTKNKPS